jgi:hypothetical protein
MGKMYAGKVPTPNEDWRLLKTVPNPSDKTSWMVFCKPQEHTQDWVTYKIVANGRAQHKANYWFVRNSSTGQIGFAKDFAIMRETRPDLHAQVESLLKQVGGH